MAFTMNVSLTGAAFTDEDSGEFDPSPELCRILRGVADSIENLYLFDGNITDAYGNVVGSFETVED